MSGFEHEQQAQHFVSGEAADRTAPEDKMAEWRQGIERSNDDTTKDERMDVIRFGGVAIRAAARITTRPPSTVESI